MRQLTHREPSRQILRVAVRISSEYRRPLVVAFHLTLVLITNYLAFLLRFDGVVSEDTWFLWRQTLPWLVVIRGLVFLPFRLYNGLWRYTGVWDLRNIIGGVLTSSLLFAALIYGGLALQAYPSSVMVIDAALLICGLGGSRLARRIYREVWPPRHNKRVLIYGAGDAGEMIVRDMKNNGTHAYKPVGFVDDDPTKMGQRIHGVRVLGTRENLPSIMDTTPLHEVLVAMPSANSDTIRAVVKALEPFKVPITTLPNLQEILHANRITANQIRRLAIEDLLPRAPFGLEPGPVKHLITGRRVMVTGAGGSIGAELCRQIAALQPKTLILFERHENSLYTIGNDLTPQQNVHFLPLIGDITDAQRVHTVLETHRPELIFHAAAHKHVPLMEENLCEAVKNNVFGTQTLAEAAAKYETERFILISTDKAVNPSSIMGATKRIAELVIQDMARRSPTRYLAVRFGNVLGSNGSVVPRFLEQIKAGGPVTVTHPEMRRYFMLIPEAVSLVLHAAALGQRGAVYVLDMGEQIKVLDMARNLIRLAGFVPEEEIPIVFVGLRPGEKLSEELAGTDEVMEPSEVAQISQVRAARPPNAETLARQLGALEQLAFRSDEGGVLDLLSDIVPSFRLPQESPHCVKRHGVRKWTRAADMV